MTGISKKDWERLSAYLDGEINQKDKERIEDRIREDPVFQAALDKLREAKAVLVAAPRLKVQRDFRLTPEMIGIKPRSRPTRAYGLAAAVLSFLFVGVVVLDFGRSFSGVAFAPSAPRDMMQEALPEAAVEALEEPALLAQESELEMEDRAADGGQEEVEEAVEESAPEEAAEAVEEEAAVGIAEEGEAKAAGETDAEAAANQADEDQAAPVAEEAPPAPTEAPQATLPAPETQVPLPVEEVQPYLPEESDLQPIPPRIDPIRILEMLFGLGAVVFGILAWFRNRRS